MSEAVSALAGATSKGFVDVTEVGLVGMVTVRGDLGDAEFGKAMSAALGVEVPEARRMLVTEGGKLLWMSPDEVLFVCAHAQAEARISALSEALDGHHHLVANVSDARAVFEVSGTGSAVREALAKLTPADMRPSHLPVGEVRRTRLAQVPAAIWFDDENRATIVCFRSVAGYVFGLLAQASKPGSELGHF